MSTRNVIDNLRVQLAITGIDALSQAIGINKSQVSKMLHEKQGGDVKLTTLRTISERSGVPLTTLVEWWAAPSPDTPPVVCKVFQRRPMPAQAVMRSIEPTIDQLLFGRGAR